MREKAKKALEKLKRKDKKLQEQFDSLVALLKEELEINEQIAVALVTQELVNRNKQKLYAQELFSRETLEAIKIRP